MLSVVNLNEKDYLMNKFHTKLAVMSLLLASITPIQSLFNVKKINQRTVYNCQTGEIRVDIKGDENAVYIARNCIFIAGAATPEKRMDTAGFTRLDLSQLRTIPFATLMKGVTFSPTTNPQYTIQLVATIDPVDSLAKDTKNQYKNQGITHGIQIWRNVKFKSSVLSSQTGTQSVFTLLQTFPANMQQENDTAFIFPNGDIVFDNDVGTITIPAGPVR